MDRMSNLPDDILQLIVSRLDCTEEVVRTSVLSKRWRYLWTSCLPSIDIDCSRKPRANNRFKFHEFVCSVLSNKTVGLDSFRLSCSNYYHMPTIRGWINAALLHKPKQLHLSFCPPNFRNNKNYDIKLPDCLVTSDSLEVLSLSLYRYRLSLISTLNVSTPFPGLRVLELHNVELPSYKKGFDFLKKCPLLEELRLIDCVVYKVLKLLISSPKLRTLTIDTRKMVDYKELGDVGTLYEKMYRYEGCCEYLVIRCPNLVLFEYAGATSRHYVFENLDSLKKAVIYPEPMLAATYRNALVFELFLKVSHLQSLSINHYFVQWANRDLDTVFPPSLPNLKTLELTTTIDDFTMKVLICILKCSPNLDSLNLTIQEEFSKSEGHWELDGSETIGILTRNLKRVEFLEFNGEKQKLDIACFLLEHGSTLEEMVFSWRNKVRYHEKSMETMNIVSKFNKASSFVKLITLLNE